MILVTMDLANCLVNLLLMIPKVTVTHTSRKGRDEEEESNIVVAVRVRPMISREVNLGDNDIIRTEDNLIVKFAKRGEILKSLIIDCYGPCGAGSRNAE